MTQPLAPTPEATPTPRRSWLRRWGWGSLRAILLSLMTAWATLVLYYSNLPWPSARLLMAIAFAAFAAWALLVARRPRVTRVYLGLFLAIAVWFALIPAKQYRDWRPEVAVLSRAIIDGDRLRIENVRNFDFRSRHDFTVAYEDREYSLSRVSSMDLFISYWKVGPVAHTFVSFNFDDGSPPLCISIETRPEVGEGFAPIQSMFKQFELIYLVGDENDLVGSRASHRNEQVYCYRIRAHPERVRQLLELYLERINDLADRPEWYHLLSNSCTINIFRYANAAGREGRLDLRHLLNGWVDQYLFATGRIDTSMSFEELRRRSNITDVAQEAADSPDFSRKIREGLPIPRG